MNFFKKIFGQDVKKSTPDAGPTPTRSLNFQFLPVPENGPKFAQQFVDAVSKNENKQLDFGVNTLDFVDSFLQRFSDEGLTVNDFSETIFVAGAYVGEVMIKNNDGIWIKQEEANLPEGVSMTPIVVRLPNGSIVDPVAKAFKRFYYGASEDIKYFYQVFTND